MRLADGSTISSQLACHRLVAIGPSQYVLSFLVLYLTFDRVLGMRWLKSYNIRFSWTTSTVPMRRSSCWIDLHHNSRVKDGRSIL